MLIEVGGRLVDSRERFVSPRCLCCWAPLPPPKTPQAAANGKRWCSPTCRRRGEARIRRGVPPDTAADWTTCPWCETLFKQREGHRHARFCSHACRSRFHEQRRRQEGQERQAWLRRHAATVRAWRARQKAATLRQTPRAASLRRMEEATNG